jgi:polysaccharide pyruvyl transferase WcaK-like protein
MKIGIIGSYAHPNFGDQLILQIMIKWIFEKYPAAEIVLPFAMDQYCDQFKGNDQIKYSGGFEELKKCDLAVFGGGGYLGEFQSTSSPAALDFSGRFKKWIKILSSNYRLIKYWRISRFLRRNKIPYSVIGPGVGPFSFSIGRKMASGIFSGAQEIVIRDQESFDWVKKLNPGLNVVQAADIALSLIRLKSKKRKRAMNVAVHLSPTITRYLSANDIGLLVDDISNSGAVVTLISDTNVSRGPVKNPILDEIRGIVRGGVITKQYGGTDSLLKDIDRAYDLIVTTKLHVGMVAYSLGVLPISLAAHIKTLRFYKQISLPFNCFLLSAEGLLAAKNTILDIVSKPIKTEKGAQQARKRMQALAMLNKKHLYQFIER